MYITVKALAALLAKHIGEDSVLLIRNVGCKQPFEEDSPSEDAWCVTYSPIGKKEIMLHLAPHAEADLMEFANALRDVARRQ